MQGIFKDDCNYIRNCDYVICYFSGRSLGTAAEQTLAYFLNIYSKKRIKTITIFDENFKPDEWTIYCSDYVFFSINECLKKLKKEF